MRKIVQIFVLAAILFTSCADAAKEESAYNIQESTSYEKEEYVEEESLAYEEYEKTEGNSNSTHEDLPAPQFNRKIIKEGDLSFEVDSIEITRKKVVESVNKYGGYIVRDNADYYSYEQSYYFEIKVPANYFDQLLDDLTTGVKKFDVKNITATDVTEEFVDLEARLNAKKEVEQRFIQLLSQANNIEEVLNVEHQIGNLRTEIESIEGRLNYLKNRTGMSTLRLTVYRSFPDVVVEEEGYGDKFGNAFQAGWKGIVYFFIGLTTLCPFIILSLLVLVTVKLLIKKSKNKKNQIS